MFFLRRGSTYEVLGSHERQTRSKAYGCGHDPPRRRGKKVEETALRILAETAANMSIESSWQKHIHNKLEKRYERKCFY
ncbi:hypothetical protein IGI04_030527 [Brassica rapa subsp. trilocularis]|uniref:Uncharacterized protein n=1 Tax=Brassica rapa subsp. trilocularis TaxID=1813537 RepID=A0ABQ7LUX4_BRACM|nr:hypothetical protein IGI04_030527 [Brassica rapa subsp. trilocularis]